MSSKDKVLEILENNKEGFTSGAAIASSLGISRNAIWKAINELRKDGYTIEAISNKGYKLSSSSDIVSVPGIHSFMDDSTKKLFTDINVYDTLASTNRTAKEMAIAGAKSYTTVIAGSQTVGRGRRDHSFYSPEGGIYMSVILRPDVLSLTENDAITLATGNAVCTAIAGVTGLSPTLKPINDLYIDDKKICGILTEAGTEFETGEVHWIVIGIGINFNSDILAFPEDIKNRATSLYTPGDAPISKNQLIAEILKQLSLLK